MTRHDRIDAAATAPRYTSYPTAPHFNSAVDASAVERWIAAMPRQDSLSLYLHIPFCDRLCWFCACHTRQTLRYEPVARFLKALASEIRHVASRVGGRGVVREIHLGGGSPTMLRPQDMVDLSVSLRSSFDVAADVRFSIEIDPNDMDEDRLDAVAAMGINRASLGIQDFNPQVQRAINRPQSFCATRRVVDGLRVRGVEAINLDLLYGLPYQTCDTLASTVQLALTLVPQRIALFGYAHVPWFKKHQTMIDEAALPDGSQRLAQSLLASRLVTTAGYAAVGIDHFALAEDGLAQAQATGKLSRNFQGYSDDVCETLIGLGPSAISRFREGYAQNNPATAQYQRTVEDGELATVRGVALTDDDRLRGWVIERLMCDFAFSAEDALARFGRAAHAVIAEAEALVQGGEDLQRLDDIFLVRDERKPFVRMIAASFDAYRSRGAARHSLAV